MSRFTDQLRDEHVYILELLGDAYRLGISSQDGQVKLLTAKQVLLVHLEKEDTQLYPVLEREAARDPKLREVIVAMREEMRTVTPTVLEFFDKYAAGGSGFAFARDFGHLNAVLGWRIRREESQLYSLYETLGET